MRHILLGIIWRKTAADPAASLLRSPRQEVETEGCLCRIFCFYGRYPERSEWTAEYPHRPCRLNRTELVQPDPCTGIEKKPDDSEDVVKKQEG